MYPLLHALWLRLTQCFLYALFELACSNSMASVALQNYCVAVLFSAKPFDSHTPVVGVGVTLQRRSTPAAFHGCLAII